MEVKGISRDDMKIEPAGEGATSELGADVGQAVEEANAGGKKGADAFAKLLKMLLEALNPEAGDESETKDGAVTPPAGGGEKPSGSDAAGGEKPRSLKELIKMLEEAGLDPMVAKSLEQKAGQETGMEETAATH